MWSIESLTRITQEAQALAQREQARQAELFRLEAMVQEQAEHERAQAEHRQRQLESEAAQLLDAILARCIQSASQFERSFTIDAAPAPMQIAAPRLKTVGIFCRAVGATHRQSTLHDPCLKVQALEKLKGLLPHLGAPQYEHHLSQVQAWIGAFEGQGDLAAVLRKVENTVALIGEAFHLSPQDPLLVYHRRYLAPLIAADDGMAAGRGSDDEGTCTHERYRITLSPREPREGQLVGFEHFPAWLLSRSGSALFRSVMMRAEKVARTGAGELVLNLAELERNPSRWGDNLMRSVAHQGTELGVSPFDATLLAKGLCILGFDAQAHENVLGLRWST